MKQIFCLLVLCTFVLQTLGATCWTGVNLSGAEFGSKIPGVYNKDYTFPEPKEVDYFMEKGMNVFRLPFLWERLQPTLMGPLDPAYLGHINDFVAYAANTKGAFVLLDVHNYARYKGNVIGNGTATSAFTDLWSKLATIYKNNSKILFGLMNEPHGMHTELWLEDANAAISAIRNTGATNIITVPGNGYTGAWSWDSDDYGTPNAKVMLGVKDPQNNFVFEVHQYLDSDGSGSHDTCVSETVGSQRLTAFTAWARQYKYRAILAEWAGARDPTCYAAITDILKYMENNKDVWAGWTWWGGGPWWGKYMFALDPDSCGVDEPQMAYLKPYLANGYHC
eukprot:TRINITY_DN1632_c0_g1_i1.p1 TRINITY_DN1632_c0_g1~~TRINITY_DN1632_c0_g1_i1.p1  ORF type:complete len:361 (+),score=73.13 TRINITY_DN1632_c0_g1_i1:77-1084(+)